MPARFLKRVLRYSGKLKIALDLTEAFISTIFEIVKPGRSENRKERKDGTAKKGKKAQGSSPA